MSTRHSALLSLCLVVTSAYAQQDVDTPFHAANRSPVVAVYGLPAASSAELLSAGEWQLGLFADVSNNMTVNSRADEEIMLDGETYRSAVSWQYAFAEGWQLGLELPYITQTGGNLDGFIEGWHKFWGMPNGDRGNYPRDQLHYYYEKDGRSLLNIDSRESGIGDSTVSLSYQLSAEGDNYWALRGGVKLPTGDSDKLTGSDAADVFTSINYTAANWLGSERWAYHGSVGLLWLV